MSLSCYAKFIAGSALPSAPALAPPASLSFSFLPFPFLTSKRSPQVAFRTSAKRKSRPAAPSPTAEHGEEVLVDEDLKNSINQLSTEAVKAMLSDDMSRMEDLRDKLFDLEIYFEKEKEEDALLFVLVIRDMLDHRVLPEAKQLKGVYKKAVQTIFSILEDSGWHLKGSEDEAEMIDDELIPPTLMSEYR